ncbi:hypothetical protein ES703_91873 [subsurface metagenome]
MIDITLIPTIIGDLLGVDAAIMGIVLSVVCMMGVLLALAVLDIKPIGLAIGGIGLLVVFTALTWFPWWIMLPIGAIAAWMIASELRKVIG